MSTSLDLASIPAELLQELLFGSDRLVLLQHRKRLIGEHLADYKGDLFSRSITPRHAQQTFDRARLMVRLCHARTWADLEATRIRRALQMVAAPRPARRSFGRGRRKSRGRGLATANHYLGSLKAFCNWMLDNTRAETSPCRGVKALPAQTDVRHARRVLTTAEQMRLIASAQTSKPIGGIPGVERALTYILAFSTGLRSGEIQSLRRASFHLGGAEPHIRIRAADTKGKREFKHFPLRAEVAEMVRSYLASVDRNADLFRRPKSNAMRSLRRDLIAAGIAYEIDGEYADFHAQRHTFVTSLFESGATPKEAQTLARHKDAKLTLGRYAHVDSASLRSAVERLPSIAGAAREVSTPTLTPATDRRTR